MALLSALLASDASSASIVLADLSLCSDTETEALFEGNGMPPIYPSPAINHAARGLVVEMPHGVKEEK